MERLQGDSERFEHVLEDGVAPSVIGGEQSTESGPEPAIDRERQLGDPPTTPIPALLQEQEKPRSWVDRMFRRGS